MRTVRPMSWLPLAAVLAVSSPTRAADADEKVVIKTYDLADLLRPARDYPLPAADTGKKAPGRAGGGGGGGESNVFGGVGPANADELPIQKYELIIYQLIASGTWKKDGGAQGSIVIAPSNTALIVAHTSDVHRQIESLLSQLREQSSTRSMVRVRASWLILDPAAVESLSTPPADAKATATGAPPVAWDDNKRTEDVLKSAEVYYQAQMTCYNGQTVGVYSGTDTAYISDLTPVVGTNAVGYDPTVDTIYSGVRLQVTPQLIPNENRVVLDLQSRVTETLLIATSPVAARAIGTPTTRPLDYRATTEDPVDGPADAGPGSASNAIAFIQRPSVADQPMNTTVRVPLGKRVIVGGMTLPSEPAGGGESLTLTTKDFKSRTAGAQPAVKAKPRTLYLVVQVDAVQ